MDNKFGIILMMLVILIAFIEGGEYLAIKLKNKNGIAFKILSGIITSIVAIAMFVIMIVIILVMVAF